MRCEGCGVGWGCFKGKGKRRIEVNDRVRE